jgi:RNA-directed DNA polymerase
VTPLQPTGTVSDTWMATTLSAHVGAPGAAKRTLAYVGWYAYWRVIRWLRKRHPRLTWRQFRRRYLGPVGMQTEGRTLYNPAAMRVERYRFRGGRISTPWNEATLDPRGARFRRTSYDDPAFLGRLAESFA